MSRKQELNERAARSAIPQATGFNDTSVQMIVRRVSADSFLAGYRAALCDARRAYNSHRRYVPIHRQTWAIERVNPASIHSRG